MSRPKINVPEQQSYGESYREALQSQVDLAPELMASEREFAPQKQQLDIDMLAQSLFGGGGGQGLLDIFGGQGSGAQARQGGISEFARQQKAAEVGGDIGLIEQYGERARTASQSDLQRQLEQQAMEGLDASGEVTPGMYREVAQPILAQYSAAGRAFDPAAAQALMRGTEQDRQRRMQQAQGFGMGVAGMQQQFDPFRAILNRQSVSQPAPGLQAGRAMSSGEFFNPEAGIGYNTQKYANLVNLKGAEASARGQWAGGLFSGLGAIGGGMAMCWVAREVYGPLNPRWLTFREWMLNDSPKWFRNLYIRHGERFARFIRNKPRIKNFIRKWMDRRIA